MPITIPKDLPAFDILKSEGVVVMSEYDAKHQDIRPLRIGLLNLMPKKIQTETQFARLIGATPLQIELTLIRMSFHQCKNTPPEHMEAFYKPFVDVKKEKFDGAIITGAPIEHLNFDDCHYWDELCEVFEWTQTNVHSTFAICWGAMAMLNYFHPNVQKHKLSAKAFGCYWHDVCVPSSPVLRGFCDELLIPVSRWTCILQEEIDAASGLVTLLSSDKVGPCLVHDEARNCFFIFNHFEYDALTLEQEYTRDVNAEKEIVLPVNYFPNDDPTQTPRNRWRCHGHLLYGNWINEIYQTTKFNLDDIGK